MLARSHPGALVVGLDTRGGRIAVDGWQATTEHTTTSLLGALAGAELDRVIHTEAARDGTLAGPSMTSLAEVCTASPWPVIAAGGIASLGDVRALGGIPGIAGAIIGRALLEQVFTLDEVAQVVGNSPKNIA